MNEIFVMRKKWLFVLLGFFLFCGVPSIADDSCTHIPVKEGIADLGCWDGTSNVTLDGEWHFDFQARNNQSTYQGYAPVPGRWRYMEPELHYLGKGVYRTELLFPKQYEHLGLKLSRSDLARKVIYKSSDGNEKILFDSGNTDLSEHSIVRMYNPVIHLPKLEQKSELIIHVNNSRSIHSGIDPVVIGPFEQLIRHTNLTKNLTLIIVSILGVFFVLNLYVWLVSSRNIVDLSLAALALAVCLRQLNISGIIYDAFPELLSPVNSFIGWTSFFSALALGTAYIKERFRKLIPDNVTYFIYAISLLGLGIYFLQPLYIVQYYGMFFRPAALISTITVLIIIIRGRKKATADMTITIYSVIVLFIAFGIDVIYFQIFENYPIISISSIGMLLFVGIETYALSKKYWDSIQQTADLAIELKVLNASLEDKIEEALSEIDILKGSLPICSCCKKIRDDQGSWNQLEAYISKRSEAEFSHGICPECAKDLYPDIYDSIYPNKGENKKN